jgi:hypothetical protein
VLVSLTVTTIVTTVALGACAGAPSSSGLDEPAPVQGQPISIRFDNDSREHVHVYLIRDPREWLLGRVDPGAVATLRLPETSFDGEARFVQLAVIPGERLSLRASGDPRATFTVLQPAAAMLSQQWMFSHGQITSTRLRTRRE